jgi:uncharacterized protein
MNPIDILAKYYDRGSKTFEILVEHGRQVANKALAIAAKAPRLNPDLEFIEKAAMLHDIGILHTDSPGFGCRGKHPYICHGVLGGRLLETLGLEAYKPVCERHVGVGISAADVRTFNLPLPDRDMLPIAIEEQIICYADKFFSKNGNGQKKSEEKTIDQILVGLKTYGQDKVERFQKWVEMFGD